jgi:hypothetical protein
MGTQKDSPQKTKKAGDHDPLPQRHFSRPYVSADTIGRVIGANGPPYITAHRESQSEYDKTHGLFLNKKAALKNFRRGNQLR